MHYSIRHLTRFRYSAPISESVMEVRMQPRTEAGQHCIWFDLAVKPHAALTSYRDHLGNLIHHFDVPSHHTNLAIKAEAVVEIAPQVLPESLSTSAWSELDALVAEGDYWEMLMPSHFATPTEPLRKLTQELNVCRRNDPHIDGKESVRADTPHLLFLQNAKQFHLKAQTGLRYLVQENRAAIGCLKQAAAAGIRAGERALLMPKQLAFQNSLGKGAAVDGGKRHLGTCAVRVNGPSHKFLARSACTANEHAGRAGGDPRDGSINFQHLWTSSDNC